MKKSYLKNFIRISIFIICFGILIGLHFTSKKDKVTSKTTPTDTYTEGTIALVDEAQEEIPEETQDENTDVMTEKTNAWLEETNVTKTQLSTEPITNHRTANEEKDVYPKTVKETEKEVVVDFSETPEKGEAPKDPPKTTDDITDKSKVPTYSEEQIKPNQSKASKDKKDTKDTAGNKDSEKSKTQSESKSKTDSSSKDKDKSKETNNKSDPHEGQVYDPVFGWVTPSPVQQEIIDNDGSLEKQVGQMN